MRIIWLVLHYIASATLVFYDHTVRRDNGLWRQDCSCVGDISSWQDSNPAA